MADFRSAAKLNNRAPTGFVIPVASDTTSTFAVPANGGVILCNSASAQTVTLPTAVGIAGCTYTIKNVNGAQTITVATTSSQTIDGGAGCNVGPQLGAFVQVISDGANWGIIDLCGPQVFHAVLATSQTLTTTQTALTGLSVNALVPRNGGNVVINAVFDFGVTSSTTTEFTCSGECQLGGVTLTGVAVIDFKAPSTTSSNVSRGTVAQNWTFMNLAASTYAVNLLAAVSPTGSTATAHATNTTLTVMVF